MIRPMRNSYISAFLLLAPLALLFGAFSAGAQTPVAIQQQFFASHGDGSSGPGSFPCCNQAATSMTTMGATVTLVQPGTYDTRTTKGGLYFAEFNKRKQY